MIKAQKNQVLLQGTSVEQMIEFASIVTALNKKFPESTLRLAFDSAFIRKMQ